MELGGFIFFASFDSGNLAKIQLTSDTEKKPSAIPIDRDYQCWTTPDCFGTEFENGNRSWFYYGMRVVDKALFGKSLSLRFTFQNLNKQSKLFSQGFLPIFTVQVCQSNSVGSRGSQTWERISDGKTHWQTLNQNFEMSFHYKTFPLSGQDVTYFAFTYPYPYRDCQNLLGRLDKKYGNLVNENIYFHRETAAYSLEGRRIDVLTISDHVGLLREEREERIISNHESSRPHKFRDGKKIIFVTARVHPGETQSSFVMNGFIKMLLRESDPRSIALRRKYIFKLIPMLNPDGVYHGHYRTDSRGVNLNRVYGNPDRILHPQIYLAKKYILFCHGNHTPFIPSPFHTSSPWLRSEYNPTKSQGDWYEMTETSRCSEGDESVADFSIVSSQKGSSNDEENSFLPSSSSSSSLISSTSFRAAFKGSESLREKEGSEEKEEEEETKKEGGKTRHKDKEETSNLFLYVDIHGHASKRGIFMYGNHFEDPDIKIESMLLPKLMSINCSHFDFPACNFTRRNMYLKDRHTGAGREGSGRVSVFQATGLNKSYTLECNFNTGRIVNQIPCASKDKGRASPPPVFSERPPKYTPGIYEDAGKAMAISILDLTESNPWTRLTCSSCKNLRGVRESIRRFIKGSEESKSLGKNNESLSPLRRRRQQQQHRSSSPLSQSDKNSGTSLHSESSIYPSKIPRKDLIIRPLKRKTNNKYTSSESPSSHLLASAIYINRRSSSGRKNNKSSPSRLGNKEYTVRKNQKRNRKKCDSHKKN